jgi:NTE family protein
MTHAAVEAFKKDRNGQVVLVLQGGGALGAYQVGVYQALHEAGVEPDWIIGTSIGAINASLIAGNAPENRLSRLQEFWSRMEQKNAWQLAPGWTGIPGALSWWSTVMGGIPGFFEVNPRAFWGSHLPLGTERAGFYSIEPLRKTLTELADFDLINRCNTRLTVGPPMCAPA